MWRLKPPHKVKGGRVDGFDVDVGVDVDFVWRLCATRYEAVGFVWKRFLKDVVVTTRPTV
ncbi:MAG: hypothetical protein LBH93_01260 [Chitinispirillales bacterium]|nr:hypothetical protein [Chitinispirillales bacterium]